MISTLTANHVFDASRVGEDFQNEFGRAESATKIHGACDPKGGA